ncbi:MAG: AraC family transcriptional regulator [Bacteroidales bacterium]|nr:AraC family transcriptional regulator [Bacteroidales bacterium]
MLAIGIGYLVYIVIAHSTVAYINRLPEATENTDKRENSASLPVMGDSQMKKICDAVTQYLQTSGAYKNSDLILTDVSRETGIHHKNISTAINGYLHRNLFELVNSMRVEEAKRQLQELSASDYTVEGIYSNCGFRSHSTFYMAFKKFEGVSPA